MNSETKKNNVSLVSIAKSIDLIFMRMATLATKDEVVEIIKPLLEPLATRAEVIELIKPLATRDEVSEIIKPLATTQLVDDLAIAVMNGFDRIDRRFAEMDERFNGVDKRFDALEEKVTRIDTRLTNGLDNVLLHYAQRVEFDQLDVRCKKLERRVFA